VSGQESPEQLDDATSHFLKEEREVQWTPHSVTVLTREELESGFKRDLEDIESIVPGLIVDRMNTTPRGAAIALRGLGSSGASKAFDPAVAVNIDGVYVGTHTNRLQVLFDFDQIEVVRSPNTFEGNPNLSGSINIERTRPTGELDVDVRASVGIDDRREMDAVINFPILDSLSGKVAVFWKDKGGEYMTNVYRARDENTEDYSLASVTLNWEFRDLFEATYTYDTESSDETTPAILNISAPTDLLCSTTTNTPFPNCRRDFQNPELDSLRLTAENYSNEREYEGDTTLSG
jgi:iron complex outermembrane receptor protein